jgi:hypothetical protein
LVTEGSPEGRPTASKTTPRPPHEAQNLTLATALLLNACAGEPNSLSEVMVTKDGFSIHGYDPVAYFTQGTATIYWK